MRCQGPIQPLFACMFMCHLYNLLSFTTNFCARELVSVIIPRTPGHKHSRHVTDLISEVIRMTTNPVVIRKFMDSTYSSKSMILIINNLGSRCLNIIRRNSINPTEYLSRSHSPSISKQLSSNILSNIGVSIKSMSMVALRLTLARSTSSSAGRSRRYRRFFSGVAY